MRHIFLVLIFGTVTSSFAQERLLTVGFQYKPIFASRFFGAGEVEGKDDLYQVNLKPIWGHNYGMIIRRGFTKTISYEVGLSYVKRNYRMTSMDLDSGITDVSSFGIVSYEIPNQVLVYIRLGERIYMNNALGVAITAFASDVESYGKNNRFHQVSRMTTPFLSASLIANIGFEYRTEKSGFFYLGASFQNPFKRIADTYAQYEKNNFDLYNVKLPLSGSYLTLDFRYFFHEKPVRVESNKTKKKKKN